ncbi:Phosphoribosyl pyrophosphate synthetase-associated protein 2, partial [Caligus rogercresseyi]
IHQSLSRISPLGSFVMEQRGMVILSGNSHPDLADDIAKNLGVRLGNSSVYHNTNRETMVEIQESVRGKDVYIVQTGSRYARPSRPSNKPKGPCLAFKVTPRKIIPQAWIKL